jgi:hypothetical protein
VAGKEKYFAYDHLPAHLQPVSKVFADAAEQLLELVPADNDQLTLGLQKLIEAKDCFVRARL